MKTLFSKNECHVPKWFVIDANQKTLGRLATEASKLLRGKETSFFSPGVDQGNFVVILNADKIQIGGNKALEKKCSDFEQKLSRYTPIPYNRNHAPATSGYIIPFHPSLTEMGIHQGTFKRQNSRKYDIDSD